jgi:GntR family transcriptional regulator
MALYAAKDEPVRGITRCGTSDVHLRFRQASLCAVDYQYYALPMMIDKEEDPGTKTGPDAAGSSMLFRLDPRSGVPTYLQLIQQVESAIRLGYLRQGDQLPRIRDVVASLTINPNTVLKAYRDLEQKGLIGARPGLGTFVEAAPETLGLRELARLRRRLVTGWMSEAMAAGLDHDGMVALFAGALQDLQSHSGDDQSAHSAQRVAPEPTAGVA